MIRNLSARKRGLLSLAVALFLAVALYGAAYAATVKDVSIARAAGVWAEACIHVDGPVSYKVKELPAGVYNYRQVAMDVYPATIDETLVIKDHISIHDGLVAQFRVKQMPNKVVRIIGDVVYWPDYKVVQEGNLIGLHLSCVKERGTK